MILRISADIRDDLLARRGLKSHPAAGYPRTALPASQTASQPLQPAGHLLAAAFVTPTTSTRWSLRWRRLAVHSRRRARFAITSPAGCARSRARTATRSAVPGRGGAARRAAVRHG